MCVDGGARAWIESGMLSPLPWHMTQEESEHLKTALRKGGISAPLCWYRAMAETTTSEDDAKISPEAAEVKQPLLFVAFTSDCIWLPIMGDTVHAKYVKGEVTRKEITGDHWGVESHAEELSGKGVLTMCLIQ
ncbi:hypothetical protein B0H14DRAFT_3859812 [Mycena olivaceomarginata]|nr:hypothetical protein B0H14DRAFT_3859812 [Mycena olivaceomarginata]